MIPSIAVKEFLNRPRDSHVWVKRLTFWELWDAISDLKPRPDMKSRFFQKAKKHQLACFLLCVAYPRLLMLLDMGLGKTSVSIELLKYWMRCGVIKRALVLTPFDSVSITWEEELDKWAPELPRCILAEKSTRDRWDELDRIREGIIVGTHLAILHMVAKKRKLSKGRRRGKMTPDKDMVEALDVDALVVDESTKIGNKGSLFFRVCNKIADDVPVLYELAGRVFGRDPTTLWSQCYLVDRGQTLGPTLGLFREAFFTKEKLHWGKYAFDYKFRDSMRGQLADMIQHRSIRYAAEECLDMPGRSKFISKVNFPEETLLYYDRMVQRMIDLRGNRSLMKNEFLRMRQLSSGFLGYRNDDTGEKAEIVFAHNPKLDRLLELIEEMPERSNAVVFYEFTWSGRRICEALKHAKIKHGWIWSGTADERAIKRALNESRGGYVLVLNNKLGSYSLNLQAANYVFFYESAVSSIDDDQAQRRVWRQGQLLRVFQYRLVTRYSVDERILDFHKEGADLFRVLVDDPARILKFPARGPTQSIDRSSRREPAHA